MAGEGQWRSRERLSPQEEGARGLELEKQGLAFVRALATATDTEFANLVKEAYASDAEVLCQTYVIRALQDLTHVRMIANLAVYFTKGQTALVLAEERSVAGRPDLTTTFWTDEGVDGTIIVHGQRGDEKHSVEITPHDLMMSGDKKGQIRDVKAVIEKRFNEPEKILKEPHPTEEGEWSFRGTWAPTIANLKDVHFENWSSAVVFKNEKTNRLNVRVKKDGEDYSDYIGNFHGEWVPF